MAISMNLLLPLVVTLTAVVATFVPWFVTRMMAGDAATELGVQIAHKNLEHLKLSSDWRVSLPKLIIEFVITQTPREPDLQHLCALRAVHDPGGAADGVRVRRWAGGGLRVRVHHVGVRPGPTLHQRHRAAPSRDGGVPADGVANEVRHVESDHQRLHHRVFGTILDDEEALDEDVYLH